MKYLILLCIIFIFNVFASSPKEWQRFYEGIESKCSEKILQYFPDKKFSKIGKIETTVKEGYLVVIFFFEAKNDINAGCIYNQETDDVEVNQVL